MNVIRRAAILTVFAVAGCTSGQVGQLPPPGGPSSSSFKLQLAVGTATVATQTGTSVVGLNVVTTFRQAGGQNATESNDPTLSGPASFGGQGSVSGYTLTQMQQLVQAKMLGSLTSFGTAIGAFGYGLAPYNYQPPSLTQALYGSEACAGFGVSAQAGSDSLYYQDLSLPLSFRDPCHIATAPITYVQYYGGPPAWPSPQGYGIPTGFIGYPLGFTDFDDVTPVAGSYGLQVQYPNNAAGTSYAQLNATATLKNLTPLPLFATPSLQIQSDGSGIVNVNVPVGVTEAVVTISSVPCLKNSDGTTPQNNRYALLTTQPGPQALVLSNNLGAPLNGGSTPTSTFCTAATDAEPNAILGHSYTIAAVGFDYPAFEASYPQSTSLTPTITNGAGQADVTTANPLLNVPYTTTGGAARKAGR